MPTDDDKRDRRRSNSRGNDRRQEDRRQDDRRGGESSDRRRSNSRDKDRRGGDTNGHHANGGTGGGEQISPKVKDLASRFKLNEGITLRLQRALDKRKDMNADLEQLSAALEKVPSPMAVMFGKIKELEDGAGASTALPDADVERIVDKFRIDQRNSSDLVSALRQNSRKRDLLRELEAHLGASDSPNFVVTGLIAKIRDGTDLGPPPRRRRSRSRSRRRDEGRRGDRSRDRSRRESDRRGKRDDSRRDDRGRGRDDGRDRDRNGARRRDSRRR